MDNHLMIFESADFGRVRSVLKDGAPWFVAVDVCKALGLNQVTRAMSRLDSDEGGLLEVPHPQNADKTIEINAVSVSSVKCLGGVVFPSLTAQEETGSDCPSESSGRVLSCLPFSVYTLQPILRIVFPLAAKAFPPQSSLASVSR